MVLGRLGMAHYEAKQYEQSAARFREALAILRLHLPREDLNVTLVVNELARASTRRAIMTRPRSATRRT